MVYLLSRIFHASETMNDQRETMDCFSAFHSSSFILHRSKLPLDLGHHAAEDFSVVVGQAQVEEQAAEFDERGGTAL